jgi:hypothetical protein
MTPIQFRPPRTSVVARVLPYAGLAAITALTLAACGPASASGDSGAPPAVSTPAPTGAAGSPGPAAAGQRQPGVNGLIAAVNGSTMQVQTRTDQTAVTWTDATAFTKVATATLADVTVGSCVTVLEPPTNATGSATSAPATAVTAASVDVRPAVNGECSGFGGFGGAGGGAGAPGAGATPPAGAPTGTATRGARGDAGRRAVAGLVNAVSGDTITVQETMRAGGSTSSSTATAAPTTTTVTATGSTTYTAQQTGTAGDVAVGECATALGTADDTGSVAATAITVRPATNGTCTTGFAGGGRGGATGTATPAGGSNG